MSLNKKNCLGFGLLRHIFVKTPSPTNTRPGIANGWKEKFVIRFCFLSYPILECVFYRRMTITPNSDRES